MGVSDICKTNFVLFFEVGELSVSLSRESLQYDENTKKAIVQRLVEMKSWLNKNLQSQIENSKNLWDAVVLYKKLNCVFSAKTVVGDVYWKNIKVHTDNIYCQFGNCRKYFIENKLISQQIKSKRDFSVNITENTMFVICDEPKFYIGKVATLLDQNPGKDIYVYKPQDDISALTNFKAKVPGFDFYEPIYLSTVVKKKMPKPIGTTTRPKSLKYLMKDVKVVTHKDYEFKNDISYKNGSGYYCLVSRYTTNDSILKDVGQMQSFLSLFAPTEKVLFIKNKYENKLNKQTFVHVNELIKKIFNDEIDKVDIKKHYMKDNNKQYYFDRATTNYKFIADNVQKLDKTFIKDWVDLSRSYNNTSKTTDEEVKIGLLIHIGHSIGDSRVNDNGTYTDPKLIKYSQLFNEKLETLNNIFHNQYYWSINDPKIHKIARESYLAVVNELFVDKSNP